jgi:hypothetical protein
MSVSAPTYTDTVNQQFFIESLNGSQQPTTYLDRFPDTVYSKALDSVLVMFLYALLGPAGVGQIKQEYLEARLQIEEAGLSTVDLDSLYTSPFAFARLAEETYDIDAEADLLSSQDRATILAQDASFRNRAQDFLKGIRAGGTLQGIQLVAKSGLNHPVDVIENYRWLWDQYSDDPLNLPYYGSTYNLNEIIILPRQDAPQNSVQSLSLSGNPVAGYFTISFPAGADYKNLIVGTTTGSNTVTVPNSAQTPVGCWITISTTPASSATPTSPTVSAYAEVSAILSPTSISVVYPQGSTQVGQAYPLSTTGSYWAFAANARTIRLPYSATSQQIQAALTTLPIVGGNVSAAGGPFPSQTIEVTFVNQLSDAAVPTLELNLDPDTFSGIGGPSAASPLVSELIDVNSNPLTISGNTVVSQIGVSNVSQTNTIPAADQHAMEVALDEIRPQTSFVTTQSASTSTITQPVFNSLTSSAMTQVLDYVTGASTIAWPALDNTYWIEAGIEHEAPQPLNSDTQAYTGFHNIANVYAYTEAALDDPTYLTGLGTTPMWILYYNTMIGLFSPAQVVLMPILSQYQNVATQYSAQLCEAPSPTPLIVSNNSVGTTLINNEYPADYLNLPGVKPLPASGSFYSSSERSVGTDYLEIDLGAPQAVNYIYFEATSKPYTISVSYDTLDMTPARNFVDASFVPSSATSTTSIAYISGQTSPWSVCTLNLQNSLSGMIYTRYIRLAFTRSPGNTPYMLGDDIIVPYGIEIRNMRIGRIVS